MDMSDINDARRVHDLDAMKQRVIEAFALDIQRLRDAALELQVDLEMCRYDHGTEHGYPDDPYDEFLYLAACFVSTLGGRTITVAFKN